MKKQLAEDHTFLTKYADESDPNSFNVESSHSRLERKMVDGETAADVLGYMKTRRKEIQA